MKTFLTTTKGKVIAGSATVAVIGAIVLYFLLSNNGYRIIEVNDITGTTTIVNGAQKSDAKVGDHLKDKDDATVNQASDLTLELDSDKYVYAKENTHFNIEATGTKEDSRTKINLYEGSTLSRIDNKLKESESFHVDTPNSTMSVRGTVFRSSVSKDLSGDKLTKVEVFEGEVKVDVHMEDGTPTGESRILKAGQMALIHSGAGFAEFIKSTSDCVYKEENPTDEIFREIIYYVLSQNEAKFLGKAIDAGRTLPVTKEYLYDVTGLTPHKYGEWKIVTEPTCTKEGEKQAECLICQNITKESIPFKDHQYDKKHVCEICGHKDGTPDKAREKFIKEKKKKEEEEAKKEKEKLEAQGIIPPPTPTPAPSAKPTKAPSNKKKPKKKNDDKTSSDKSKKNKTDSNQSSSNDSSSNSSGNSTQGSNDSQDPGDIKPSQKPNDPTATPKADPCAKGHTYGDYTVTKEANCTTSGQKQRTCKVCGTVAKVTLPKNSSHDYSVYSAILNGNGLSTGQHNVKCSRCGDTKSEQCSFIKDPDGMMCSLCKAFTRG